MLEVALLLGWLAFPDDGVVNEAMVGTNVRLYVTPKISIGPELTYVQGDGHTHTMLTGNVTWDVRRPQARVVPFLVGGVGAFQTRERFVREIYTSYDPSFTAGGGVRTTIGSRVTAGAEARIGWELHLRVNAFVGVRLLGA